MKLLVPKYLVGRTDLSWPGCVLQRRQRDPPDHAFKAIAFPCFEILLCLWWLWARALQIGHSSHHPLLVEKPVMAGHMAKLKNARKNRPHTWDLRSSVAQTPQAHQTKGTLLRMCPYSVSRLAVGNFIIEPQHSDIRLPSFVRDKSLVDGAFGMAHCTLAPSAATLLHPLSPHPDPSESGRHCGPGVYI